MAIQPSVEWIPILKKSWQSLFEIVHLNCGNKVKNANKKHMH